MRLRPGEAGSAAPAGLSKNPAILNLVGHPRAYQCVHEHA